MRDILIFDQLDGERHLIIGAGDGMVELVKENENRFKDSSRLKSPSYPLLSVVSFIELILI